ncbi:NHLP bacteriocin export ABC transporter permease/ATPase subunit [Microcoleus sp. ARI1-B5]|uniref:NHLP bacteriocin export ABC transporter permease/ATPase subunit n=1 Tax=Microcoleus sp. ARI1-B5 TaxID=2818563 RepID=UPI002FD122BA
MEGKNPRSHENNGTGSGERQNFFPKISVRDRNSPAPISQTADTVTDAPTQPVFDRSQNDRNSPPLLLNPAGEVRRIRGNEPLLLDDAATVWAIESGTLAVFATEVEADEPAGHRHYLFSVSAGEALFGAALRDGWAMLAVAIEQTELLPLAIADFTDPVAADRTKAIALLETWVKHLGEQLTGDLPEAEIHNTSATLSTSSQFPIPNSQFPIPNSQFPIPNSQFPNSQYLSLQIAEVFSPENDRPVWVNLSSGIVWWMGIEDLKLDSTSARFPIAPGMWLLAETSVELQATATAQLENSEQIPAGLALLHAYFFDRLNLQLNKETAAEFQRFLQREELNQQVTDGALGQLVALLHPQETKFFEEETPLLAAAGAVGRAMGIAICPPAKSADLSRLKDPMEAIARSSQFRTRQVLLAGNWWRCEHGPLLAYMASDNRPVALLPRGNNYVLFDGERRTWTPVTAAVAKTLLPEAQMFYRPLPLVVLNVIQVFRFGIRGFEKSLFAVIVLGIAVTLLGMVTPQATAIVINDAIPGSDRIVLWQIGLVLLAATLGKTAFQIAQTILTLRVENAAEGALQPAVWDKMLNLKPAFFRNYSSGDLLTRLQAVSLIRSKLSGATQRTLLSAVFSLLNLGLMFFYSVRLALVGIGLTLVAVIVTGISSVLLIRKERKMEMAHGEINGLTVELINGVSKLRVAAAEGRAFAAWAKKYSQRIKLKLGIKRIDDSVSVFNEVLPLVSSLLMFWFAILFMQMNQAKGNQGLNAGTFLAFNSAFGTFLSAVTDLSNTLTDILGIVPLWERARAIVQGTPESDPSQSDPGRLKGHIVLDRVTFRYRDDGPMILEDVSIQIKPGEFVAIVGPSGSGKSTIFRLLLGFETPQSGTVFYDDQDLMGVDIQALRRQLGVVLQNGRMTTGSIFDNLTCGALVTLDEAWEAARMAGFAEDIDQMPMGMHTVISEGGTNLSGGQRQRLLIARAIVLKPKIILMDEATSALDNRTQAIVTESLDKLNATRVVIAHRLSTIRNADRIYVIEAGRLVEAGSFDELAKQEGLFARLVARQL